MTMPKKGSVSEGNMNRILLMFFDLEGAG